MVRYYVEMNGMPVQVDTSDAEASRAWAAWFVDATAEGRRRVALSEVTDKWGRTVRVSTVFLGMDHSFDGGEPLIYETMVFPHGGRLNAATWRGRWSTRVAALAGHEQAVAGVRAGLPEFIGEASEITIDVEASAPPRRIEQRDDGAA